MNLRIKEFKLGIGIPANFPMVYSDFWESFCLLEKPGREYELIRAKDIFGGIADLRNHIVKQAKDRGCSHLIMMDADQVYPPDGIIRLFAHNLPVVGGLICRRYPPFEPLIFNGYENAYPYEWDVPEGSPGLIEVEKTGTGCILFDMEVFSRLPAPWFHVRKTPEEPGGVTGEDTGFCKDLRAAGYKIMIDLKVQIGHLAIMEINLQTWFMYRAMARAKLKSEGGR